MKYRVLDLLFAMGLAALAFALIAEMRSLHQELRWHQMQITRHHEQIHDNNQDTRESLEQHGILIQQLQAQKPWSPPPSLPSQAPSPRLARIAARVLAIHAAKIPETRMASDTSHRLPPRERDWT